MILHLPLDPLYLMPKADYIEWGEKEFIRRVGKDRFHAIITGWRVIDLHFDKTLQGGPRGTYHSSKSTAGLKKEISRIRKIS